MVTSRRDNFKGENNKKLSDEEVRLLDCLVSSIGSIEPNALTSGSAKGQRKEGEKIWDVVYTVSQANDGTSTLETSQATQFKFAAINKIIQSNAANQPEGAVSSSPSLAFSGDVERKYSLAGFPYLVSTGTSLATSRSAGAMSTDKNENESGNRDVDGGIKTRGDVLTTKCRIGLKLSFSSMKYFGFISQAAASSSDADSTVELIGITSDKNGKYIL